MAKQLTLFGTFARQESDKNNYVYKYPAGQYQCFIERYFQRNRKSGRTKQIIVTEAQDLWKRASEKEKQAFEALLPGEKPFNSENSEEPSTSSTVVCRKAGDGWFQSDRSTEGETSSSQSADVILVKEYDAKSGQSLSRTLLSSPNVANGIHGGERESYLTENEKQEVVSFLEALCPPIVTEDVINNNSFVASAIPCAKAYNYYQELCQEYRKQELRKGRGSKLSSKMKEIDGLIQDLRSKLKEASEIDLDLSSGTSALAFKATLKQKLLSETTARFVRAHSKLTDGEVLRALRRRVIQQKQVKSRPFTRHPQEQLILECQNSETLTWEEAYNNLEHLPDGVLTALQLRNLAMVLEEALCMTLGDVVGAFSIASDDVDKALTAIFQNFTVLYVSNGRVRVLINVHEMVLTPDVFEEILAINNQQVPSPAGKKPTESSNQEENSSQSKDSQHQQAKGRENVAKAGRPSLVSKFPDIIPRTTELLKQHSFQAESRRRTSTATGNGVSLAEIQKHLYRTVPGLKEHGICRSTIHSLFVPPRKGTLRAQH